MPIFFLTHSYPFLQHTRLLAHSLTTCCSLCSCLHPSFPLLFISHSALCIFHVTSNYSLLHSSLHTFLLFSIPLPSFSPFPWHELEFCTSPISSFPLSPTSLQPSFSLSSNWLQPSSSISGCDRVTVQFILFLETSKFLLLLLISLLHLQTFPMFSSFNPSYLLCYPSSSSLLFRKW